MKDLLCCFACVLALATCKTTTDPATGVVTSPTNNTPVNTAPVATTTAPTEATSLTYVGYTANDVAMDTTIFGQPVAIGELSDASLVEASGLAVSRTNPGYFWTEEDSGNPNQIQLLSREGKVMARFIIDGAENRDWEDMTIGPGPVPNQTYLYVADIGDNKLRYPEKVVYRFPEPVLNSATTPYTATITGAEILRFTLPDGAKNAESILLDPKSRDLYILTKEAYSTLYLATYPQSTTSVTLMTRQVTMPFDRVTSAGISPNGSEILVRTYGQLFYYVHKGDESVLDALKRKPVRVPLANENQGEAVGWATDGSAYYTTSEKTDATFPKLYRYRRK